MGAKPADALPMHDAPAVPRLEAPPIGIGTKLGFSASGIATSAGMAAVGHVNYYLNQVLGLAPLLVGVGIMGSLVLDSLVDPLIGEWSDNVRSRLGRRHPFMYAAAVLAPLAILLFWHTPGFLHGAALAAYTFMTLAMMRIAISSSDLASGALLPELAPGYNERTWLLSYKALVGIVAAVTLGLLVGLVFLRKDVHHPLGLLNQSGYEGFSVLCAVLACAGILGSALGTQGRVKYLHSPPARRASPGLIFRQIGAMFTNRSVLIILVAGTLGGTVGGVAGNLQLYLNTYFWNLTPQQIAIFGPVSAVGPIIAIFVAPMLSARLGKRPTMLSALLLALFVGWIPIVLKLLGLMPTDIVWVIAVLALDHAVTTTLSVLASIVIGSMVADAVEDNAVQTGQRSEALFFAANGLMPKIAAGLGAAIAGAMLTAVHFPTHAAMGTVPMAVMRHLVLLYMPAGWFLSLAAIAILSFYNIDESTQKTNLERLREMGLAAAVKESVEPDTP